MDFETKKKLIQYLSQYVTSNKWEKMQIYSKNRTRYLTVVLEDIYQGDNISASIRSCEGFGLQDIYVIEQRNRYALNIGITKGASDWIDIKRYNNPAISNTEQCYQALRAQGYRIVATTPDPRSYSLSELPIDQKTALIFGTELTGVSDYALEHADAYVTIPMYGFTESFNISVSVALCAYDFTLRMRNSDVNWKLSPEEESDVVLAWLERSVRNSEHHVKLFLQSETS